MRVRYRPLRVGWCIAPGDREALRTAFRLTHTLWGGRYNPVIVADDVVAATRLARTFSVDFLHGLSDDSSVTALVESSHHVFSPLFGGDVFLEGRSGQEAQLLDISHSLWNLSERRRHDPSLPALSLPYETQSDPLADSLLATMGDLPTDAEIRLKYEAKLAAAFTVIPTPLDGAMRIDPEIYRRSTLSTVTSLELRPDERLSYEPNGLYVGDAASFDDLVLYWNIRAAGHEVLFYDPSYEGRLAGLRDAHLTGARQQVDPTGTGDRHVRVWHRAGTCKEALGLLPFEYTRREILPGSTPHSGERIPLMTFGDQSVLASVSEYPSAGTVTVPLPAGPTALGTDAHSQLYVASVRAIVDLSDENLTLWTPNIPELNPYFGRENYFIATDARVEPDGLGIIIRGTSESVPLRAMQHERLITELFKVKGIEAELSQPGLLARRLIHQMGGVIGCRVFAIPGVRELIEKHSPVQSFTRSLAIQTIRAPDSQTGEVGYSLYEELLFGTTGRNKSKPEDAFTYLLEKGVFRVGLRLDCPNCDLEFWLPLDDVRTRVECEYCGTPFMITPQLRDRDWAFRRSGLFGRDDHQGGGIPVALTLRQLLSTCSSGRKVFSTAMELTGTAISPCETDFVFLTEGLSHTAEVAIGEVKTRDEITQQDLDNLARVARVLSSDDLAVYVVLSKLAEFTPLELEMIRNHDTGHRYRFILLSNRELEPLRPYERAAQVYDLGRSASSLRDMAANTVKIFFDPRVLRA